MTLELDFGQGFEGIADMGRVTTGTLMPPGDPYADGNLDDYRVSFISDVLAAPLAKANTLRLRWTTDGLGASQQWVFGLDNVVLNFLLVGDFDGDGQLTAADMDLLSQAVRAGDADSTFDVNGDDRVDASDRERWVRELAGTTFGDANLDHEVGFADFLLLSNGFGTAAGWGHGDFDGDGETAFPDFLLLAEHFGATQASAVPEPSCATLIVMMALAGAVMRRARR